MRLLLAMTLAVCLAGGTAGAQGTESCPGAVLACNTCVTGTTLGYANDHDCGEGHEGPDVVYQFTLAATTNVTLIGAGDFDDADWSLSTECGGVAADLGCFDWADPFTAPSCGSIPYHDFGYWYYATTLPAGTYYVWIDGFYETAAGAYALELQCDTMPTPTPLPTSTPAVPGDHCDNAFDLNALVNAGSYPQMVAGDLAGATAYYSIAACSIEGAAGPELVYTFTPDVDRFLTFDLCGGSPTLMDSVLHVRRDGPCPGTTEVACDEDGCGAPTDFLSQLGCERYEAGVTYYLFVDTPAASTPLGTFELAIDSCTLPSCPPGSLFGQVVHAPDDFWEAYISDQSTMEDFLVFENYSAAGSICDIHWWGLNLECCWTACDKTVDFEITFYSDNGGQPGAPVASQLVTPARVDSALAYGGFPLYYYSAELSPCVDQDSGWVSIQALADAGQPDCLFLWMSSGTGDGRSYQWDGLALAELAVDMSLCLTGPAMQLDYDLLIPFWQNGAGEQTFFSIRNALDSDTAVDLTLWLFDQMGGFVDSSPVAPLAPGAAFYADTGFDPWYSGASAFGGAIAQLSYATPPTAADRLSAWAAVYSTVAGAQPGFSVLVPGSPMAPGAPDRSERAGSGVVPIPYWETRGGAVTFYALWNSPGSTNSSSITITYRDLAGMVLGTAAMSLAPGEFTYLETVAPLIPAGDHQGFGEIEIDYGPGALPNDQLTLWSTIYGLYGGTQVGFPINLEAPPPVFNGDRQITAGADSPFWQSGLDLETRWCVANTIGSPSAVSVWVDLYDATGIVLADSSPITVLQPGQAVMIDTVDVWYNAGQNMGVATVMLDYTAAPATDDIVTAWSSVYSDPQPGDAQTGFTVSIPDSPIRPAAAAAAGAGAGTVMIPFWQHGLGLQTFFSLWNSPDSPDSADITISLRGVNGLLLQTQSATLAPGEAWMLDTQEPWYASGSAYGPGEIAVSFADPGDPANRVQLWEAVYGMFLGYQVGYPVELR